MSSVTRAVVVPLEAGIRVELIDERDDVARTMAGLSESERNELAAEAWRIGWKAMTHARTEAQESRLADIGQTLTADIERRMQSTFTAQEATMMQHLRRFFDPKDGEVTQRLTGFIQDEGPLVRVLQKYLAADKSVLADTLAKQVGAESVLFQKLSPSDTTGILHAMKEALTATLQKNQAEVERALDPTTEGGSVARFLKNLREELARADNDRTKQIQVMTAALDANNEQSLLSRLVRESESARRVLLTQMNPDIPDSPMAALKNTLAQMLRDQAEKQTKMEIDLREALARMETKKKEERSNARGGVVFEEAVLAFVKNTLRGGPHAIEATGNSVGLRANCKKGDVLVRFTEESAFAGSALIIEAKRDSSYGLKRALEELDEARENRAAACALFIMAKSHAPSDFPHFGRYGNNVLVVWDDESTDLDPYLEAAITCALALATRRARGADDSDLHALEKVEQRLASEMDRLHTMTRFTENIRKNADSLAHEIQVAEKKLTSLVTDAKRTLRALNVELFEERVERSSPIRIQRTLFDSSTSSEAIVTSATALSPGKAANE